MSPLPQGGEHEKESHRLFGRPSLTAEEINVTPLYSRCAGLDVHKKSISVCIRIQSGPQTEIHTAVFTTFTRDLEALRDSLRKYQVRHIAIESTGVYWIPVWNVLERSEEPFDLTLVNPQHAHALRGRKTDRQDAGRLAELLQYGLLRGSFIPPPPVRELRDLTRRRTHLQQDRNRAINRIARWLETANIKLGSVVSDLTGKTSTLILHELAYRHPTPEGLAELARGSLKRKKAELIESLNGFVTDHFRWLLKEAVRDLEALDRKLLEMDRRIAERLRPYQDVVFRLCTIPGVDFTVAAILLAEIGLDMNRFPTAGHLASWAGLCPGNNESGGKRLSGRTRDGNRYLRRALVQSAWSILHKKDCFLTALFHRAAARGGRKKAAIVVAHRVLIIAWHLIREGGVCREAGGNYYDRIRPDRTARRLARRLEQIGFEVALRPKQPLPQAVAAPAPSSSRTASSKPADPRATTDRPLGADPRICPRCAKWKIPCIHARNALLQSRNPDPHHQSLRT
jgi:transposase